MKKVLRIGYVSAFLLALILSLFPMAPSTVDGAEKLVYVIPVEDTVESGLLAFINRSIEEAEDAGADLIIYKLHTPGGLVDAASDISKSFKSTSIPSVAFIDTRALSAGAYLALYADKIYMTPGATMGAAAVITGDGNAADKKSQSYWLQEMENAAESSGRDPLYAKAMADTEVDLPELGAPKGELLTLGPKEALEIEYSEGTVKNLDELLQTLGYEDAKVVNVEVSFAESVARFLTNPIVVSILLSVGSLGLVLELYSPGFGIPGFMGISALLLFFYGHLVAGLAGMETMILFILGVIFIVLEIFVPGGILGVLGLGAVITSFFLATGNIVQTGISLLVAMVVTVVAMVVLFTVFGKRIRLFDRIILRDSTNTEQGYVSNVSRIELVGQEGVTLTPLRPSGTAVIREERIDVVTEGSFIGSNKRVRIVKAEGPRIVVREIHTEDLTGGNE
ncbi:membrane-bound serine protease (ClpP class) [Bacillus tianshenii]|uniref:Membrane-bound serine protease (ClpP class) n=1 Tax=Sutcliffiella tianshenii TaxID=1463404 RepID=A0ABS2P045_9BACI|nr:nodulation protein NfeD [Bacillus tianshenii]MBM7620313.1 membrane-bound serine protease (ClpP class) [Bacillus tianshenii]